MGASFTLLRKERKKERKNILFLALNLKHTLPTFFQSHFSILFKKPIWFVRERKGEMGEYRSICSFILVFLLVACASGEDPYRFYNWNVTYGDIYPLGIKQRVPSFSLPFILFLVNESEMVSEVLIFDNMTGYIDKWAISRATNRVCHQ